MKKENRIDAWTCGKCYHANPTGNVIMLKEEEIETAFLTALNRLLCDYDWAKDEFEQTFLPLFASAEEVDLENLSPEIVSFTEHAWHSLLDQATVTPDRKIVFLFKNGRKETADLQVPSSSLDQASPDIESSESERNV